jgi:LysM repeat protein
MIGAMDDLVGGSPTQEEPGAGPGSAALGAPTSDDVEPAPGTAGSTRPVAPPPEAASSSEPAPVFAAVGERPGAGICTYLRVPGSAWRAVDPRREHRCTAVEPPISLTPEKQQRLCLVGDHVACPLFQDARDRRVAMLTEAGLSDAAIAARRSRPLVRTAPLVLEGRSPGSAGGSWIASRVVQATIGLLALAAIAAFVGARLIGAGPGVPAATPSATTAVVGPGPGETPVAAETAAPSGLLPSPELTAAPTTPAPTSPGASPETGSPTAEPTAAPTVGPTAVASRTYKVKKGDTLFAIAQRFDTTVAAIIKLNKIKDPALIHAGLVLKIP